MPKKANSEKSKNSPKGIEFLSILIPGLGQFIFHKKTRGVVIFLVAVILAFLVNWSFVHQNIGNITLGSLVTSWLWIPLILFWIWNIWDAHSQAINKKISLLPVILFSAIILYVIAWDLTNIDLNRMVTHFKDMHAVVTDIVNPDLVTISVNGQDEICAWRCMYGYISDKLASRPVAGPIRLSDTFTQILGDISLKNPPKWEMDLGLAAPDSKVNTFIAGSMIQTIAMGLMATLFSTILAIPISFFAARNIMDHIPGGGVIYYLARGFLNIVRAVDTIVWGIIVVVWVGLGPFAGVIALTIHSTAALGKLFSEEIEHIDPGPVEAVTATGANLIQVIRYAVIPQLIPPFLSYSLLRWDINMRSATVIGFVAGGGIGFFVIENVRLGGYQQYATALWAVVVVIILVDYISEKWRENILRDEPKKEEKRPFWKKILSGFYILIGVIAFIYCWNLSAINLKDLLSPGKNFGQIITSLVSIKLTPDVLQPVILQLIITVLQALLATTIGTLFALPFSFLAAKNLTGRSRFSIWIYYLVRSVFNFLRSIEALLYVVIFIFWVGIGPFAGMMALAVTSFALIGKLFSEAIENIETGPIEAVTATGANKFQMIIYAVLPQITPPFVSYLLYQWDINIRMATIIGFAGGGGIGFLLITYFNGYQYRSAGTVVAFIVIIVALMDFISAKLRHELV